MPGDNQTTARVTTRDVLVMNLRGLAMRMKGRVEAIEDRDGKDGAVTGPGIGIGYLLASDLATCLERAADALCEACGIEDTTPDSVECECEAIAYRQGLDDQCPTCRGAGTVNPLTAPPRFLALSTTQCPTCEGLGYV